MVHDPMFAPSLDNWLTEEARHVLTSAEGPISVPFSKKDPQGNTISFSLGNGNNSRKKER
jgi:hypothetical protein